MKKILVIGAALAVVISGIVVSSTVTAGPVKAAPCWQITSAKLIRKFTFVNSFGNKYNKSQLALYADPQDPQRFCTSAAIEGGPQFFEREDQLCNVTADPKCTTLYLNSLSGTTDAYFYMSSPTEGWNAIYRAVDNAGTVYTAETGAFYQGTTR